MKFPDPERTGPDGLVLVGGELSSKTLIQAYSQGIFPWPHKDYPVLWFSPPERGVLFLDQFKVPQSTKKAIKNKLFQMTMNKSFKEVIENCAEAKRKQDSETWILPNMIQAYCDLFDKGHAFSVEAWSENQLVGGLYGVSLNGFYSGESMFFKKTEASKVCLVYLIEFLKKQGCQWLDIQMVTPLTAQFGGEYIERRKFLDLIK